MQDGIENDVGFRVGTVRVSLQVLSADVREMLAGMWGYTGTVQIRTGRTVAMHQDQPSSTLSCRHSCSCPGL